MHDYLLAVVGLPEPLWRAEWHNRVVVELGVGACGVVA